MFSEFLIEYEKALKILGNLKNNKLEIKIKLAVHKAKISKITSMKRSVKFIEIYFQRIYFFLAINFKRTFSTLVLPSELSLLTLTF